MRRWRFIVLQTGVLLVLIWALQCHADNGLSVGYGFGFLNEGMRGIQTRDGNYDYLQVRYLYERSLSEKTNLALEPFVTYLNRPEDNLEGGVFLLLRAYPKGTGKEGFYLTGGGGPMYTGWAYSGQGSHLLFGLTAGVGYRWKQYFLEERFVHYSNGGTASPNRSLNSSVFSVGVYF